ncbi:MAG TPA: hypothetical protein VGQ76_24770 [Thermoanaerobaculia bacterium]|nr:hypothetical protein [Thermoanaerobaculia bacterium]
MIILPLSEKVTQRIHVIAEPLSKFLTYGANLRNHGIFRCHGASSSSGVQTIGGSYPLSRQILLTIFSTTPFAM